MNVYLQLSVSYFLWVLYQYNWQELYLRIFLWSKVVYNSHTLSNWAIILGDDTRIILEALKIILICLKYMLPASKHWNKGFQHCVGRFLVSIKLKHESLDDIKNLNKTLVSLDVFIFDISPHLVKETLSKLYLKDCKLRFIVLFRNLLSVKKLIYFSVQDSLLDHS